MDPSTLPAEVSIHPGRPLLRIGAVALGVVPLVLAATVSGDSMIHAGMVLVYVVLLFFTARLMRERTPWPYPSPITTLTFYWFLIYGPFTFQKFIDPDTVHRVLAGSFREFHQAMAITVLSNALMVAGYLVIFPGRLGDRQPRVVAGALSLPAVVAIWGLAILARGIQFVNGQFGYVATNLGSRGYSYQMILTYGGQLAFVVLAALFLEVVVEKKNAAPAAKILLGIVVVAELIYAVAIGFKGAILHAFVPVLLVMLGLRVKFPLKSLVVAMAFVVFIAPGNYAFRDAVNEGRVARGDVFNVLEASIGLTFGEWGRGPLDALGKTWTAMTREIADNLENVALILRKTPSQVPYWGSEEYMNIIPRTLFPRFLWKGKPSSENAGIITRVYREGSSNSGSPTGFTGDLFMRTGMNGVALGSLGLGFILGIHMRIFSRFRSKRALVVYCTAIGTTIYTSELASLSTLIVQRSLIFGFLSLALYHSVDWASAESPRSANRTRRSRGVELREAAQTMA
ncbi:MAG: hypothetical protein DCC49_03515 [Acidobacteria bacterium]|nr:MAG: hypothetical protein DCC49_03515 [Acidobacteriota bacterium]